MKTIDQISQEWKAFEKIPFPEKLAGCDVNDVCVTSLDSFAAGIISGFDGGLSHERRQILSSCLEDLDKILPDLEREAKIYFQLLKDIGVAVMKYSK
ncbi:MAG: hypothetical protein GY854_25045 [Deltaproteobacteria bacterium]|nr:hypothetical protein [Deltaproteobacteria bacterium]